MTEAPGMHNPNVLPPNIPAPQDDGAANHLTGMRLPDIALPGTDGASVNLSALKGRTVVYIYPRTGVPGVDLLPGWDDIPGARGCTPQSCSFRDHFGELARLGVAQLFGLSTQDTAYQQEAATRLHLPFAILSDEKLGAHQGAQAADLRHVRHDVVEAHGVGDRRRRDCESVLSGVSAGQERGRGDRLASGVQIISHLLAIHVAEHLQASARRYWCCSASSDSSKKRDAVDPRHAQIIFAAVLERHRRFLGAEGGQHAGMRDAAERDNGAQVFASRRWWV